MTSASASPSGFLLTSIIFLLIFWTVWTDMTYLATFETLPALLLLLQGIALGLLHHLDPVDKEASIAAGYCVLPVLGDQLDRGGVAPLVGLHGTDLTDNLLGLLVEVGVSPLDVCPDVHHVCGGEPRGVPQHQHQKLVRYLELWVSLVQCLPPGVKPGDEGGPRLSRLDGALHEVLPQHINVLILVQNQLAVQELDDLVHCGVHGLLLREGLHHESSQSQLVFLVVVRDGVNDGAGLLFVSHGAACACLPCLQSLLPNSVVREVV